MSHTPGPWYIWKELAMQRELLSSDEITNKLLYESQHGVYAGNPRECTRSHLKGHTAHICDIDTDCYDFDDDEEKHKETALANARLIAAAPELLEAAMLALSRLNSYGEFFGADEQDLDAIKTLRAAITKATGEMK
jgi:ABC-type lipoprotein release transport system permease subunit